MDTVVLILGVVLGSIIFGFLNKAFTVFYFGFKGMATTWLVCVGLALVAIAEIATKLGIA